MDDLIPTQLTTLGHPQRLAIFRLLMRRYPDHVPAGEIGAALDIKPSTMSTYLAALQKAGLVTQERAGTSLRYAVEMARVRDLFDRLLNDCCRGRPEICLPASMRPDAMTQPDAIPATDRRYNVLFICTGNSARSIFAETLLRDRAGERFNVYSAGTRPRSELNPIALRVLADKGHDTDGLRAKDLTEFSTPDAPALDFVFTVCNRAANEECPAWDGQPISGHWGIPDPVAATGTDAEKMLAFQEAYGALKARIDAFCALPLASLDRITLQSAVDEIGRDHAHIGDSPL